MMWLAYLSQIDVSFSIAVAEYPPTSVTPPKLDVLMLFGFLSAVATLTSLSLIKHSKPAWLALAICLAAQGVFGFLAGAWPLGMVTLVASLIACRWWWNAPRDSVFKDYAFRRVFDFNVQGQSADHSPSRLSGRFDPRVN